MSSPDHRRRVKLVMALSIAVVAACILFVFFPERSPERQDRVDSGRNPSRTGSIGAGSVGTDSAGIFDEGGQGSTGNERSSRTGQDSARAELPDGPEETHEAAESQSAESRHADVGIDAADGRRLIVSVHDRSGGFSVADTLFQIGLRGWQFDATYQKRSDARGILRLQLPPPGVYSLRLRRAGYLTYTRALRVEEAAQSLEIDAPLERGASLRGRTVDSERAPLSGVKVRIWHANANSPLQRRVITSPSGSFAWRSLAPGRWNIIALKSGYRARGPLSVEAGSSQELILVLEPDDGLLIRTVNDAKETVGGAEIQASVAGSSEFWPAVVSARSDGLARIFGLPKTGDIRLVGTHAEYPPTTSTISLTEDDEASPQALVFQRPAAVRGQVIDASGQAVSNARVQLAGESKGILRSTSRGEFLFSKLARGNYNLIATTTDRGRSKTLEFEIDRGGEIFLTLEIVAEGGEVQGRILDAGGNPVRLAPLRLRVGTSSYEEFSKDDGSFIFSSLPRDSFRLFAGSSTLGWAQEKGRTDDDRELRISLQAPGGIFGVVDSPGSGSGFSLRLVRRGDEGWVSTRTFRFSSNAAFFRLRNVEAGTYDLHVDRKLSGNQSHIVDVLPGETTGPLFLTEPAPEEKR